MSVDQVSGFYVPIPIHVSARASSCGNIGFFHHGVATLLHLIPSSSLLDPNRIKVVTLCLKQGSMRELYLQMKGVQAITQSQSTGNRGFKRYTFRTPRAPSRSTTVNIHFRPEALFWSTSIPSTFRVNGRLGSSLFFFWETAVACNVNGEYSWLADRQRTCVSLLRHKSGLVIARDSRIPIVCFVRETAL